MDEIKFDPNSTNSYRIHCMNEIDLMVKVSNGALSAFIVLREYRGPRIVTPKLIEDLLAAIHHYYAGHAWKSFDKVEICNDPIIINCRYENQPQRGS